MCISIRIKIIIASSKIASKDILQTHIDAFCCENMAPCISMKKLQKMNPHPSLIEIKWYLSVWNQKQPFCPFPICPFLFPSYLKEIIRQFSLTPKLCSPKYTLCLV